MIRAGKIVKFIVDYIHLKITVIDRISGFVEKYKYLNRRKDSACA